jgi:hypothetical protein
LKRYNFQKKKKEFLLTIRILFITIFIRFLLSFTKFPRLLEIVESKKTDIRMKDTEIQNMIHKINKIACYRFFLIRNNCLKKNLLFYYILIQSGVKGIRIHIGISKKDAKLDGHCWLTLNGTIFQDSEEFVSKYVVIYSSGV